MKSCPTCNRTFEDTLTYCLVDGAILSAPFDPQATQRIPEARNTNPRPTELLPPNTYTNNPNLPPTVISPLLQPTQPYIPSQFAPPSNEQALDAKVMRNKKPVGRIIAGLSAGIVLGVIIGLLKLVSNAIPIALFLGLLGAIIGKISLVYSKK